VAKGPAGCHMEGLNGGRMLRGRLLTWTLPVLFFVGCPSGSREPQSEVATISTQSKSIPVHPLSDLRTEQNRAVLASKAEDPELAPGLRVAALRRSESIAPKAAVETATKLASATDRLVRENAIAVLARSSDPSAAAAIESLPAESKALALDLRRAFAASNREGR
jgi:hypothetical protein